MQNIKAKFTQKAINMTKTSHFGLLKLLFTMKTYVMNIYAIIDIANNFIKQKLQWKYGNTLVKYFNMQLLKHSILLHNKTH
jgi:hypothetical protein